MDLRRWFVKAPRENHVTVEEVPATTPAPPQPTPAPKNPVGRPPKRPFSPVVLEVDAEETEEIDAE